MSESGGLIDNASTVIEQSGDDAIELLVKALCKEVHDVKTVIGVMILKNKQREAIDEANSEAIMQLSDEIRKLSARIAELEQAEYKVLH